MKWDSSCIMKWQFIAEMMSVERVAIFWVVNASSGEKSCLQLSIPTGSGADGEGGVSHSLKAMCHTDVEAPMVTNWFPYFLPTSLFFGSKRCKLLFSYSLPTITCFALSRKTYWFGEIRETDSLPWELQRRYATLP